MPIVRLSFTPAPAHVRTARLVGVAVARRAGVAEELLDEVRQAIGEACSRAVALHLRYGLSDLVQVEMSDTPEYAVRVTDRAPVIEAVRPLPDADVLGIAPGRPPGGQPAAGPPDGLSEEAVAAGMALALLTGLVDDLQVRPAAEGPGTEVRMTWPVLRFPR